MTPVFLYEVVSFVRSGLYTKWSLYEMTVNQFTQWFWRRRFSKFVNVFSQFFYHIPLETGGALCLNKFNSPSPKNILCQVWLKLTLWLKMLANHYSIRSEIFLNGQRGNKQSINSQSMTSQFHKQTQILSFFLLQLTFTIIYFLHSFNTSMLYIHVYVIKFV